MRKSARGRTGHNEVVLVVYDPKKISYEQLLKTFWESHDPTQGMRQGNDVGTQYRSGIYVFSPAQRAAAEASKAAYAKALGGRRMGPITTEIIDAPPFYFAEDYHQQYLAKNPHGYCGLGGTGVSCPIGTGVAAALDSAWRTASIDWCRCAASFSGRRRPCLARRTLHSSVDFFQPLAAGAVPARPAALSAVADLSLLRRSVRADAANARA